MYFLTNLVCRLVSSSNIDFIENKIVKIYIPAKRASVVYFFNILQFKYPLFVRDVFRLVVFKISLVAHERCALVLV